VISEQASKQAGRQPSKQNGEKEAANGDVRMDVVVKDADARTKIECSRLGAV
jgi:hypothetical protein